MSGSPKSPTQNASPESAAPADTGRTPTALEVLAAALNSVPDSEPDPTDPNTKEPEPFKPDDADLGALAKHLKVADADLYKVKVPSAREGADPYTLGQLKDLAAEHDSFAVEKIKYDDEIRRRRAEIARAEQEVTELFSLLPKEAVKPEIRERLQQRRDAAAVQERQRVLEAIPEWRDVSVRTQELESMVEHLKDHGFPAAYLSTVLDHRTLRYIRENMKREQQIRKALEKVTAKPNLTPPKSGTKPPKGKAPAKPNGSNPAITAFEQSILRSSS